MAAYLRGSVGTGTKEVESSTGRVCAAGFHHVRVRSRLARDLKLVNCLFLYSPIFFSGRSNPRITETAGTESADTGVRLCVYVCVYMCVYIYIDRVRQKMYIHFNERKLYVV